MKKGMYLFSLVSIMLFGGLIEMVSGFILWFVLPSGAGRGSQGLAYLGLTRHTWIDIHDWVAIALVVVVVIHIAIHWKWMVRMTRQIVGASHSRKVENAGLDRAVINSSGQG